MNVEQIYSTVNSIANNISKGQYNVVDYSSFVAFGNDIISSETNREKFYETLVDRIGLTIIAIDNYLASKRGVMVDSFTFGSILQKISYKLQDASENSDWSKYSATPYDVEMREGIVQKLFAQNLPTFSYEDVILNNQLESAFTEPSKMSAFIDGLYQRMRNAKELAIEGMEDVAVSSLAIKKAEDFKKVKGANITRTFRDLLGEYNDTHTPITSVSQAMENDDFLEYVCIELGITLPKLKKLTTMYNDGTVERSTTEDELVVEMPIRFTKTYDVKLKGNTFHDNIVNLPNYNTVPYWISDSEEMSIKLNNGTSDVEIDNVICIMRDKDACVCTLDRERVVNFYDVWNNRTVAKLTGERRYIADTSENVLVFYLDGTKKTVSFNKGAGTGTMADVTTYKNYLVAPESTFTKESAEFTHWTIGVDTTPIYPGDIVNLNSSTVTLKANFS